MKTIYAALLVATSFATSAAYAGHKEDCDRPDYAQQYAEGFSRKLNGALDRFKDQDKHFRAILDGMRAAMVKAGAWTEVEATVFMIKASVTDSDAKALEAERKKAASEFKVQLFSLEGIPIIAGGNKGAELRATCLLGPNAVSKADLLFAATDRAWKLLESKVAAEAQAKNVAMP